jgi:hypothetical protein
MTRFFIRVAQLVFHKAGYRKDEAYRMAQEMVDYMMDNLDECRALYQIEDEFDLAYHMARERVAQMQQHAYAH